MSLFVVPDLLAAAAGDLAVIEQALSAGNAAAAVPTAGVTAAAADEVSERSRRCSERMPSNTR